jgi:acetyltransferase
MIRYCRERGVQELAGEVLSENEAMMRLVRRLGFKVRRQSDGGVMSVTLDLTGQGGATAASPHQQ